MNTNNLFGETRKYLSKCGFPSCDDNNLPTSHLAFEDEASFRIEVPTVNSVETLEGLLSESEKLGLVINRVTETYGMFRHTSLEIKKMVHLCSDYGCELAMSTGPRATYDTSASANSSQGIMIAYRLRGQEQVIRAIEDIKRGIEYGVKLFVIYDEGLLFILNKMREDQFIPDNVKFKISAHCGHGNPISFRLLQNSGADSINAVRDLQLSMLSSIRQAVHVPIDCHTDNPPSSGGFIRVYEAPEIVRIASPVYLKTGNSVISTHGRGTSGQDGVKMARQASIVVEMLERHYPAAKQSKKFFN